MHIHQIEWKSVQASLIINIFPVDSLSNTAREQKSNGATPHRRKSTPPILTRHLYHHTPLVEYILKHLYMYPRTRVFGSWDITQTYHHPYAYICMHMHSYEYTCVHLHADVRPLPHPRLTLHAYACMCIHMYPYACRCVHMHAH